MEVLGYRMSFSQTKNLQRFNPFESREVLSKIIADKNKAVVRKSKLNQSPKLAYN